jgi:hypothetical protein
MQPFGCTPAHTGCLHDAARKYCHHKQAMFYSARSRGADMALDDEIVETPDGPMTWAEWKKKNPVQIPSRRTKGKKLPVKVKRFTSDP